MNAKPPPGSEFKHPSLEGHPAWEAFKAARYDSVPVSQEETRAVERARRGQFTRQPPHVRDVEEA